MRFSRRQMYEEMTQLAYEPSSVVLDTARALGLVRTGRVAEAEVIVRGCYRTTPTTLSFWKSTPHAKRRGVTSGGRLRQRGRRSCWGTA